MTYLDYLNQSRPPRDVYEQKEAEGLEAFFQTQNWPEDDLMAKRMREHPTFFLMCHWRNHFELKSLERFPEIRGKVLDVGCGSGHLTVLAAEEGYDTHGVDKLESAVNTARFIRKNIKTKITPMFWLADVEADWLPEDYDSAWLSHIVEHVQNPSGMFSKMRKYVNGPLLISVPLANAYPDPDHKHRWDTKEEFVAYISKWLNVVRGETDTDNGCIRVLCTFRD